MFYTKIAKFISAIILFLGMSRVLMGILVVTSENTKLALQYFGNKTSGEAIDQGFLFIFIAIILGLLTEISVNLHNNHKDN